MEKVVVNIRGEKKDVTDVVEIGADLGEEMAKQPARIAYFGRLLAEAQTAKAEVDAAYRKWRADMTEGILATDPKLAEWKVNAKINASEDFTAHQSRVARAEEIVHSLWAVYDALLHKSDMLRSKGARQRAELEGGYGGLHKEHDAEGKRQRAEEAVRRDRSRKAKKPERKRPSK